MIQETREPLSPTPPAPKQEGGSTHGLLLWRPRLHAQKMPRRCQPRRAPAPGHYCLITFWSEFPQRAADVFLTTLEKLSGGCAFPSSALFLGGTLSFLVLYFQNKPSPLVVVNFSEENFKLERVRRPTGRILYIVHL